MTGNARVTTRGERTAFPLRRVVLRRALAGTLLAVVLVLFTARPAAAHGGPAVDEPPATNWRSRVTRFESPVPGLSIAMIDAGEKVELTNSSDRTVIVVGYENEPYLRVGPDGVFENGRSPAAYLNASITGGAAVPDTADAKAAPEWRPVSSSNRVSWHDHRSHWMGGDPPPAVQGDPGREQVVIERWTIPLEFDGQRVEVVGDLTWVPAPPGWPWFVAIAALAVGVGAAAFSSRWKAVVWAGAGALLASCAVDIAGAWWDSTDPVIQKVASLITPSLAFAFLISALVLLDKRRDEALLLLFGGSAGVAVFFGWTSRAFLTNSQLPTALPPALARLTVTIALGVGVGLMLLVVGLHRVKLRALLPAASSSRDGRKPTRPSSMSGSSPPSHRRLLVFGASAIVGLAIIAVLAARPSGDSTAAPPVNQPAPPADVSAGLCTAITAAAAADTNAARRAFDDIHTQLHVIAQDESTKDRARAARLLEAKQRVESDLAATPAALEADLRALHTITSTITPPASPAGRC